LVAADLPAEDRPAFLDGACAGDPELRRRLDQLLLAHDCPDSLPTTPPEPGMTRDPAVLENVGSAPGEAAAAEGPGARVGPDKLVEPMGEGGMGSVWLAQQTEPVRRLVALKLIKPGMDSGQVIARFEAERQALALMDHPHIARVLDAGAA